MVRLRYIKRRFIQTEKVRDIRGDIHTLTSVRREIEVLQYLSDSDNWVDAMATDIVEDVVL